MTQESEGFNDDLVVLDVIHRAPNMIATSAPDSPASETDFRVRVQRTVLALRVVQERRIQASRWDLISLIESCNGQSWSELALDAYVALDSLGGSQTYLLAQLNRASERPFRAAAALLVLARNPSDELVQCADEAVARCLEDTGGGLGYATLHGAYMDLIEVDRQREQVEGFFASGERVDGISVLLRMAWLSYTSPEIPSAALPARMVHAPGPVFAKRMLGSLIEANSSEVRGVLDSLTWRYFKSVGPEVDEPEGHLEYVNACRAQVLEMFPGLEQVR
ncbi:MAG: hypothetical protein KDB61_05430 [Planctomycetes bacterium]|nr:hypothetical protein [Planctomycetota bacterium]